jgi:hypothetical protein
MLRQGAVGSCCGTGCHPGISSPDYLRRTFGGLLSLRAFGEGREEAVLTSAQHQITSTRRLQSQRSGLAPYPGMKRPTRRHRHYRGHTITAMLVERQWEGMVYAPDRSILAELKGQSAQAVIVVGMRLVDIRLTRRG